MGGRGKWEKNSNRRFFGQRVFAAPPRGLFRREQLAARVDLKGRAAIPQHPVDDDAVLIGEFFADDDDELGLDEGTFGGESDNAVLPLGDNAKMLF